VFTTFIVQPIFNLLALIYALLPGHNFGLAIIIFTVVVRIAIYPLLRKQLHQAKLMRQMQPAIKEIKKKAAGDRQKESMLLMELYKERGINPIGSIGVLIPQMFIFIGLYLGLRKVVDNPQAMIDFTYPALQQLPWLKELAANIHKFDNTLFGLIDLTRVASSAKGTYWPAMLLVLGSAVAQFYQSRQLVPKNTRGLREILKATANGEEVDAAERSASTMKSTSYLLPIMIFIFTIGMPAALSLYWLTGALVAIWQQGHLLKQDELEMEAIADKRDVSKIPEAEIVSSPKPKRSAKPASKKAKRRKKK